MSPRVVARGSSASRSVATVCSIVFALMGTAAKATSPLWGTAQTKVCSGVTSVAINASPGRSIARACSRATGFGSMTSA
jgi:hypothetical protein